MQVASDISRLEWDLSSADRSAYSLPHPIARDSITQITDESLCGSAISAHNALYPRGDSNIVSSDVYVYRIGHWPYAVVRFGPKIEYFKQNWQLILKARTPT